MGAEDPRVNIRNVDPAVWLTVRSEAVLRRVPVGAILNEALREWLERRGIPIRPLPEPD